MNTPIPILKQLWLGFTAAIAIYVFIGYQSLFQNNQPIVFNYRDLGDGLFLGAVALAVLLATSAQTYLPKVLMSGDPDKESPLNVLQFAFAEVAGILGLILFFARGSFAQLVVLCAIAFVSMLKLYPRNTEGA